MVFILLITKALYANKKKSKKIALQSLCREMNPHFLFNSLNSVNQFIAENNELEANKYLSSYSKLMRNMLENSNKDFITLATEMERLREYIDLEYMRFRDKFTYTIEVDGDIDPDVMLVPNMLIQPQLENAIWHGLRYKTQQGELCLSIRKMANKLVVTVADNGIGYAKSQELKTQHQKKHRSLGLNNTRERIKLLNTLNRTHITMRVEDKTGDQTGVIVTITFPIIYM